MLLLQCHSVTKTRCNCVTKVSIIRVSRDKLTAGAEEFKSKKNASRGGNNLQQCDQGQQHQNSVQQANVSSIRTANKLTPGAEEFKSSQWHELGVCLLALTHSALASGRKSPETVTVRPPISQSHHKAYDCQA
eukprot:2991187-Rhodomonas_salina.1